jgi:hypothetical protein
MAVFKSLLAKIVTTKIEFIIVLHTLFLKNKGFQVNNTLQKPFDPFSTIFIKFGCGFFRPLIFMGPLLCFLAEISTSRQHISCIGWGGSTWISALEESAAFFIAKELERLRKIAQMC